MTIIDILVELTLLDLPKDNLDIESPIDTLPSMKFPLRANFDSYIGK